MSIQAQDVATQVHRVEVWSQSENADPLAARVLADARQVMQVSAVRTAKVFLIEAPLDPGETQRVAQELLADPVNQKAILGAADASNCTTIEVHYQPGVMDPVAQSTREAIAQMLPHLTLAKVEVRTATRYDFESAAADPQVLRTFAKRSLGNVVIQDIHLGPYQPQRFEHGRIYELRQAHVPIRHLDEQALRELSRDSHLFLSLHEMRAIQAHYRHLDREPTDIELETLAQTWSEHCVHKTFKATIRYTEAGGSSQFAVQSSTTQAQNVKDSSTHDIEWSARSGHTIHADGSVTIENLLKSTVAAATSKLRQVAPHDEWLVSVFEDNAGIVKFDEDDGVCIKVETHNHPSAIEPYGGAATGIGGCIRDVLGTGLCARPIANTDVFAVAAFGLGAKGDHSETLPKGVIHPKRVLEQVVAGVRDYGNRMGIPTVNGAVVFHERFLGNPLVFAGCVGILPLDKCFGEARPGDRIIVLGGATGRDGIHGATFSSAELTDAHADEFGHAVQIGNAITQKKMMDVILQARDHRDGPLFSAITDCGAGGFSSAVGEMGQTRGAIVHLERAPLKYAGLNYCEIWISEAQERMVLAVPPENSSAIRQLCDAENVGFCDLGEFGLIDDGEPTLSLNYHGTEVGRLSMCFLHDGLPAPVREATWGSQAHASEHAIRDTPSATRDTRHAFRDTLHALLSHPNIASKHWIIRQYDHEVQGASVVKPLVGPEQDGPSDAAVIRPKLRSRRGVAIGCGLAPQLSEAGGAFNGDSYQAALHAIDEAVRNVVCVGADSQRIALLDNFCWPSCDDPAQLGALVRAAEACYDGALAYRTPFVSGKDSLNNQFTTETGQVIAIPPTLLITALGIVADAGRCVTMDAKSPGHVLLIVGATGANLGGSHLHLLTGQRGQIPRVDLSAGPANAAAVAGLIADGLVASAHDCSEGGLLVAAAEMAFAGRVGLELNIGQVPKAAASAELDDLAACFAETPSRYLLEVAQEQQDAVQERLQRAAIPFAEIGRFADHDKLVLRAADCPLLCESLDRLREVWRAPLDW